MKIKKRYRLIPALMAAMFCMTAFSTTAYAGGPDYEEPTEEIVIEDSDTKDEKEISTPLTLDGNLTLVDDVTTKDDGEKQFITVVSKTGNYFYLVIDRTDDGEGNVHFLNLVDEADLMALIEDGEENIVPVAVCTCTEKCVAGQANINCAVCRNDLTGCASLEQETQTELETEETNENNPAGVLVIVLIIALAGGGTLYYLKYLKPKQSIKGGDVLEDFEFEDEEYDAEEPEEEPIEDNGDDTL